MFSLRHYFCTIHCWHIYLRRVVRHKNTKQVESVHYINKKDLNCDDITAKRFFYLLILKVRRKVI